MSRETISISIWFIAALALLCAIAVVAMDANAQVGPVPTPTATPIIAPRPMNICAHPKITCVYLSVIRNDEVVTGDVQ